jgi:hypothetical protein
MAAGNELQYNKASHHIMYKSTKQYSIVFHTAEDFKRILKLDPSLFGYKDFDESGIELFWAFKAKRDKAIRVLDKEYGISVDWFDFE